MSGKFEIFRSSKNDQYYFRLKARNGEIILASEGYIDKAGCKNGVASVRENAPKEERYARKTSVGGHPYFNLTSSNYKVIGVSEMYSSVAARENGIQSVKNNAPEATLVDLTT